MVPPALSERPFRDALDVARTATFAPEEWETYERAKMVEQDARGALAVEQVIEYPNRPLPMAPTHCITRQEARVSHCR